jgi:hypothetical protein
VVAVTPVLNRATAELRLHPATGIDAARGMVGAAASNAPRAHNPTSGRV